MTNGKLNTHIYSTVLQFYPRINLMFSRVYIDYYASVKQPYISEYCHKLGICKGILNVEPIFNLFTNNLVIFTSPPILLHLSGPMARWAH